MDYLSKLVGFSDFESLILRKERLLNNKIGTPKWVNLCVLAALVLVFVLAVGCQGENTANTAVSNTAVAEVTESATVVPDVIQEPAVAAPADEDLLLVANTLAQEAAVDECLACHIDKEQLIATADPEEEVIKENEGAG